MKLILKSGILRRVALTKAGDLDITIRYKGKPDAGYTRADIETLHACWQADELLDTEIFPADDSHGQST